MNGWHCNDQAGAWYSRGATVVVHSATCTRRAGPLITLALITRCSLCRVAKVRQSTVGYLQQVTMPGRLHHGACMDKVRVILQACVPLANAALQPQWPPSQAVFMQMLSLAHWPPNARQDREPPRQLWPEHTTARGLLHCNRRSFVAR